MDEAEHDVLVYRQKPLHAEEATSARTADEWTASSADTLPMLNVP